MSTIFLAQPPFIVDAGPCPGVYASAEAYHGYLKMKGIEPMAILMGFPPSNTICCWGGFQEPQSQQLAEWDTQINLCSEIAADDPQAGPNQDAEWMAEGLHMVEDVKEYGDGRNINFGKRARDVVSSNGAEIPAET
jgi:hypothetical protein